MRQVGGERGGSSPKGPLGGKGPIGTVLRRGQRAGPGFLLIRQSSPDPIGAFGAGIGRVGAEGVR